MQATAVPSMIAHLVVTIGAVRWIFPEWVTGKPLPGALAIIQMTIMILSIPTVIIAIIPILIFLGKFIEDGIVAGIVLIPLVTIAATGYYISQYQSAGWARVLVWGMVMLGTWAFNEIVRKILFVKAD